MDAQPNQGGRLQNQLTFSPAYEGFDEADKAHLMHLVQKYPNHVLLSAVQDARRHGNRSSSSTISTTRSSTLSMNTSTSASSYGIDSANFKRFSASSTMSLDENLAPLQAENQSRSTPNDRQIIPQDTQCQEILPSTGPSPEPSRLWCTFNPQCHPGGFGRTCDWKRHEEHKHETGQLVTCTDCGSAFLRKTVFERHHASEHRGCRNTCSTTTQLHKKAYACGFRGCSEVFIGGLSEGKGSPWYKRCQHVHAHMVDGKTTADWSYNRVIRNLLRQPNIVHRWEQLVSSLHGNIPWSLMFRWQQANDSCGLIKYQLELSTFNDIDQFLQTVYQSAMKSGSIPNVHHSSHLTNHYVPNLQHVVPSFPPRSMEATGKPGRSTQTHRPVHPTTDDDSDEGSRRICWQMEPAGRNPRSIRKDSRLDQPSFRRSPKNGQLPFSNSPFDAPSARATYREIQIPQYNAQLTGEPKEPMGPQAFNAVGYEYGSNALAKQYQMGITDIPAPFEAQPDLGGEGGVLSRSKTPNRLKAMFRGRSKSTTNLATPADPPVIPSVPSLGHSMEPAPSTNVSLATQGYEYLPAGQPSSFLHTSNDYHSDQLPDFYAAGGPSGSWFDE
ncbi:hypothetical protein NA57DRAFT_74054 [Rhizodiscina lignyota]|uniref:C2H2-type domain-containing protein n=1 Tax=Rhizodiscina lignyota TaxID=1504668 RepID=A0A9P4IF65_9PEZI|nr:hypothetical protein NA57DRAFT_74054 [Rhizodiscina lignyota]